MAQSEAHQPEGQPDLLGRAPRPISRGQARQMSPTSPSTRAAKMGQAVRQSPDWPRASTAVMQTSTEALVLQINFSNHRPRFWHNAAPAPHSTDSPAQAQTSISIAFGSPFRAPPP